MWFVTDEVLFLPLSFRFLKVHGCLFFLNYHMWHSYTFSDTYLWRVTTKPVLSRRGILSYRAFSRSDSNWLFFVFLWNASLRHISIEFFLSFSEKTYLNMLNLLTKENVTIYQQRRPETLPGFFSKQCFSMSSL